MVASKLLRNIVGFSLKGIGLFWSLFDKFMCQTLCGNSCSVQQSNDCSFLFLFVGIIFIICGFAVIVMKDTKRRALKTKIKNALKMVK